jgi:uncharacterized protein YjbJ (UPF0337 family)
MDEKRVEGTVRDVSGKVQEGLGRVTGDSKTQAEGIANQALGTAQDLYGQATDAASDSAATLDKWFRNAIERQPYTTAIIAMGIGLALGRLRRS